ncbi:unnamed protein product [Nippostrongylus brasiliensis]|uniref:Zf-C4_Topoisom domain-containing protein n=1 Tax=Nippostrongylus brasiliensis TaxID=27835 RepID=A0A0N4Y5C6_NIPBR|nr:unnamed protein product [Nippostrongylus brasiliensis]
MLAPRRVRRNLESQYCEPCTGGYYGRKKREAERDKCMRRDKRAARPDCEVDEFLVTRMKRQAYNPQGILDVVKLLSKTMGEGGGPGGCMKFPACVLAQKKRRKRHAERTELYHKQLEAHKQALKDHEEQHIRQKRQFFAPDANAACVPCPAWVTLALASRKKRSTNSSEDAELEEIPRMSLTEAIADIRKRAGYKAGFDTFRRRKCERCGSGFDGKRVKRNFGSPTINASEQTCMAFPQCRHRVKRNGLFVSIE